jgi:hypothetical protein
MLFNCKLAIILRYNATKDHERIWENRARELFDGNNYLSDTNLISGLDYYEIKK